MRGRPTSIFIVLAFFLVGGGSSFAQSSVGFAEPDSLAALTAYRLPDWGYRTWDLFGALDGGGIDGSTRQVSNRFATTLNSRWSLVNEGEDTAWSAALGANLDYVRSHNGTTRSESSGHTFRGVGSIELAWRNYLGAGPFSYAVSGDYERTYRETESTSTNPIREREFNGRYERIGIGGAGLDLGIGRLRDVTPLVRAARLSERLVALGRPALTRDQVIAVAEVLATEQGYRTVFERSDRRFWHDVLDPVLAGQEPLSALEILYLRDVLAEDLGPRNQGFLLGAGYGFEESRITRDDRVTSSIRRGPALSAVWARNLSLHHQLTLSANLDYTWVRNVYTVEEGAGIRFQGDHLWNVADRYRLDTMLRAGYEYREDLELVDQEYLLRSVVVDLSSSLRIYLEDSLNLVASVQGGYDWRRGGDPKVDWTLWKWSYGIGVEYALDRFLY
ncbi:MAG: hypothetical protein ABIK96_13875 [bacterium]